MEGDPGKKEITLEWDAPATLEKIKATLKEINYPARGITEQERYNRTKNVST